MPIQSWKDNRTQHGIWKLSFTFFSFIFKILIPWAWNFVFFFFFAIYLDIVMFGKLEVGCLIYMLQLASPLCWPTKFLIWRVKIFCYINLPSFSMKFLPLRGSLWWIYNIIFWHELWAMDDGMGIWILVDYFLWILQLEIWWCQNKWTTLCFHDSYFLG